MQGDARARARAHATQGTRASHSCAHCGPSTRPVRDLTAGPSRGPVAAAAPAIHGAVRASLRQQSHSSRTHNANRKDAAYYAGMSTRVHEGPRGGGLIVLFLPSGPRVCVRARSARVCVRGGAPSLFHRVVPLNRRRIGDTRGFVAPVTFSASERKGWRDAPARSAKSGGGRSSSRRTVLRFFFFFNTQHRVKGMSPASSNADILWFHPPTAVRGGTPTTLIVPRRGIRKSQPTIIIIIK